MAAAYCYEGIPLRFLASLFDIQMRYLVYMKYLWCNDIRKHNEVNHGGETLFRRGFLD